jgi:hypothetical protein
VTNLSVAILFISSLTTALGQPSVQVAVCELLRDPSEWNGRLVQISADVEFDGLPERGPSLSGRSCQTNISVNGLSFRNLIAITDPQRGILKVHTVEFEWDEGSRLEFRRLLQIVKPKTEHIRVTVVGLFETRSPLSDLVRVNRVHPDGQRLGLCVGSALPAQILVKTVTSMRIEKSNDP